MDKISHHGGKGRPVYGGYTLVRGADGGAVLSEGCDTRRGFDVVIERKPGYMVCAEDVSSSM